jgi:hypothetical protein
MRRWIHRQESGKLFGLLLPQGSESGVGDSLRFWKGVVGRLGMTDEKDLKHSTQLR